MLVLLQPGFEELSRRAADIVAAAIRRKPNLVLGLATGGTPRGLYRELIRLHREGGLDFSAVTTFNLDEYLGLSREHPQSYSAFMWSELFRHVNVQTGNVHIPDGMVDGDPADYCLSYESSIREAGGIDLQILGIGRDGHIGFNEPTSSLGSRTRVKTLMAQTLRDNRRFFGADEVPPECAITMEIGTILEARRILLLASGVEKSDAIARAVEGPISSSCSASALQLHPWVTVVIDEPAASRLQHLDYYRHVMETTARVTPQRIG